VCVCKLSYPACNAHAPCCHLWLVRLCNIFPHYLINGMIFEKKVIEHKMCVLIFSTVLSHTFLIPRRNERDMIKNLPNSSYKLPAILVNFSLNLDILDRFLKNPQISDFIKILPVGAELFHADGRTDTTKLIVAFRNFAISQKNSTFCPHSVFMCFVWI
jgi:hypothetical protein